MQPMNEVPFETSLAEYAEDMLDACTRCGKCVEACPSVEPAGISRTTKSEDIIGGAISLQTRKVYPSAKRPLYRRFRPQSRAVLPAGGASCDSSGASGYTLGSALRKGTAFASSGLVPARSRARVIYLGAALSNSTERPKYERLADFIR